MVSLRRLLAECKHVESPSLNMETSLTKRGRPVVGPGPLRVQVDDSIRTNRLVAAILAVGLVAVLFALPQPDTAAAQGLGASVPTSPSAGARSASPPSPTQSGESSVDAILVFVNGTGSPSYSFRGHSPAVPLPVNAPLVWSWFSGNPGSPHDGWWHPTDPLLGVEWNEFDLWPGCAARGFCCPFQLRR